MKHGDRRQTGGQVVPLVGLGAQEESVGAVNAVQDAHHAEVSHEPVNRQQLTLDIQV